MAGDMGKLEVGVQQGGGGGLGDLAPHQPVLPLDKKLMVRRPEIA